MARALKFIGLILILGPLSAMFAEPFFDAVLDRFGINTEEWAGPFVTSMFDIFAENWFRAVSILAVGFGIGIFANRFAVRIDRKGRGAVAAIKAVAPSGKADGHHRASPGINFRLHYRQDRPGQFIDLVVTPECEVTDVVAVGSYATIIHSLSEATWRWANAVRLDQRESLMPSENLVLPLIERTLHNDNPSDQIKVVGQNLQHRSGDPTQGDMVLVKVTISTDLNVTEFRRLYNFRLSEGRQFIDVLDIDTHTDSLRTRAS